MAQNGLLDFLQGASNSVASNVSAPVDGIAWLLRKAGLPIPSNPVGGSDWMAQKGITAQPQNKVLGLLGEVAGGVGPMVAAAKAPQLAKGLLQMEANAMSPRTLNPETGAIVWHGSPHKFDKFDASKIGTGEGAQAYGHGLYVAESPDVAGQYQSTLAHKNFSTLKQNGPNNYDVIAPDGTKVVEGAWLGKASKAKEAFDAEQTGSLYKIDLPDEHIAKMLDWDKPLGEQHPDVQAAMSQYFDKSYGGVPPADQKLGIYIQDKMLGNGFAPYFSQDMQQAGIPGIKYLDGGSRTNGMGSSNFVVFPGNEGLLSILERNGQPVNALTNGLLGR